jgi:hypothetical protein
VSFTAGWQSLWVEVECPTCEYNIEAQIIDVSCQVYRRCPCCLTLIHFIDAGGAATTEKRRVDSLINESLKGLFG